MAWACGNCGKRIDGYPPKTSHGMGQYCKECIGICSTCGGEVNFVKALKCNLCYEVESRLDKYLESKNAQFLVLGKLIILGVVTK